MPLVPQVDGDAGISAEASYTCGPSAYFDRELHPWLKRDDVDRPDSEVDARAPTE